MWFNSGFKGLKERQFSAPLHWLQFQTTPTILHISEENDDGRAFTRDGRKRERGA